MLREIRNARQHPGEFRRRWFFSHEQDLIVWYAEDDAIVSFQLCYAKYRDERAIWWKAGLGFSHLRVDDGEGSPFSSSAPILVPDGAFESGAVIDQFLAIATEVPGEIVEFVAARLRDYPEGQKHV